MADAGVVDPRLDDAGLVAGGVAPLCCSGVGLARGGRVLLDDVTLELARRPGVTVILGPNGAGKSLLLRVVAGLVEPDRGRVRWGPRPPDRSRATRIGFVFQKPVMLRRSVLANVTYALRAAGVPRHEREARARSLLAAGDLGHLERVSARVLSGGEQQRVALVRALATKPEALLLDEPTASLDPRSTQAIEALVRATRAAGVGVVLVTHDLGQARRLADEVVFIHRGRVLEQAPAACFFDAPSTAAAREFLDGGLVL
ncbi:MAG: ATP-binding cassette domain-containing protein [Ectothiorhodospiraceae bacterium]|nr:ATP-binding cassette domain-containing protein [Ectothiorhodospiraceae bacterium]